MNGPLAQRVALTCHGNAAIAGRTLSSFFPGHSTCGFCESVTFVALQQQPSGKVEETMVARTPDQWLAALTAGTAIGVRLSLTPEDNPDASDRMLAGFVGGGGNWSVEVMRPDGTSEIWLDRWVVGNRDAPDNRIWRVTYGHVTTVPTAKAAPADLSAVTAQFEAALERTLAFAEREAGHFAGAFRQALACLAGSTECKAYHRDLAIAGSLPEEALALLNAAQPAWVFGGMGSWNDLGFDGAAQVEYEAVSDELFNRLRDAILAATNSSLRASAQDELRH